MIQLLLDIAPFMLVNLLSMLGIVAHHAFNGDEIRRRDNEEMERYIQRSLNGTQGRNKG